VINRVSDLFAGHPNLIQGFNTFLPPGYRIECGHENNPNSIRVTTPSGSTIHSIGPGRGLQSESALGPAGGNPSYSGQRTGWQQPVQHSVESPEQRFNAPVQNGGSLFNQGQTQPTGFDGHNQPHGQRGGPQAQTSNAPGHPPVPRNNTHTPTPGAQPTGINGNAAQQASMEKRGPVEFNHAISYVNKIKVSQSHRLVSTIVLAPDLLTFSRHFRTVSKTDRKSTNSF
jgi:paired amphipathic helix protein Sin3a